MSVKNHVNYRFLKQIQQTSRLICSSHEGISFKFTGFYLISDRLNCKVVGANFNAMQNVQ